LGLFAVASVLRWLLGPAADVGIALNAVAITTLVWWAAGEVLRGVNPWRRFLGAGVLTSRSSG
jgi:hypothetical protein